MLFTYACPSITALAYAYTLVYTATLISLLWTLKNTIVIECKTLQGLSTLKFNSFYLIVVSVTLLSMAGVPPFAGFFTKLFILSIITNSNLALWYTILFVVLMLGLYLYFQAIRFVHSTRAHDSAQPYLLGVDRRTTVYYDSSMTILLVIICGAISLDDIVLITTWLIL